MDFGVLRRRLTYSRSAQDEPQMEEEVVLARRQPRALEDGREVEDRMTLPPLMDEVGGTSMGASHGEREGRMVRAVKKVEDVRSSTESRDEEGGKKERERGEREVTQEEPSTQTPARFSMATPPSDQQEPEPSEGWMEGQTGAPRILGPVLDQTHVRRMEEMQNQSPLIYTRKAEEQLVQGLRPEFLEEERKKIEERELRKRVEDLAWQRRMSS